MKALSFKIPKPKTNALLFQVDNGRSFYDKLHQHEEIQLSLIVEGEGDLVIGDRVLRYSPGTVVVIGSYLPHLFKSDLTVSEKSIMRSLFFTKSMLETITVFEEIAGLQILLEEQTTGIEVQSRLNEIHALFDQLENCTEFERFIHFLAILQHILEAQRQSLSSIFHSKLLSKQDGERMQKIMDYAMNHFKEAITLETISEHANMTRNAFCRYFKQRTNKSFFQFLNEVRLEHASTLLRKKEGLSIDEVAERSGFRNMSNFNRQFKSYRGITPREWRKG